MCEGDTCLMCSKSLDQKIIATLNVLSDSPCDSRNIPYLDINYKGWAQMVSGDTAHRKFVHVNLKDPYVDQASLHYLFTTGVLLFKFATPSTVNAFLNSYHVNGISKKQMTLFFKFVTCIKLEDFHNSIDDDLIKQIYASCAPSADNLMDAAQPAKLRIRLYDYQKKSLHWMLEMENNASIYPPFIDLGFNMINPFTLDILSVNSSTSLRGGILAEEMGLGKTIEVISLILCNQASDRWLQDPNNISATLIITPIAILQQWANEIARACRGVKVLVYDSDVTEEFNQYDIILTTYNVLRQEFYYVMSGDNSRSRRNPPKYHYQSRLSKQKFWRIVIDEAQMVENVSTLAAQVLVRLKSEIKWVVTGTPLGKHVDDLYGLLYFLDVPTLKEAANWKFLRDTIEKGDAPGKSLMKQLIIRFVKQFMRRTSKNDVVNEFQLPPQKEHNIFLQLSPLESYNYGLLLGQFKHDMEYNEHVSFHQWFTRLRQACCHIELGNTSASKKKESRPMHEVLERFIRESKSDIGSLQRAIIQETIKKALFYELEKKYHEALKIYGDCESLIRSGLDFETLDSSEMHSKRLKLSEEDQNIQNEAAEDDDLSLSNNIRYWNNLKHQCLFNQGSIYLALEEQEKSDKYFENAEKLRSQSLKEIEDKIENLKIELNDCRKGFRFQDFDSPSLPHRRIDLLEYEMSNSLMLIVIEHLVLLDTKLHELLNQNLLENYEQDSVKQERGLFLQEAFIRLLTFVQDFFTLENGLMISDLVECYSSLTLVDDMNDLIHRYIFLNPVYPVLTLHEIVLLWKDHSQSKDSVAQYETVLEFSRNKEVKKKVSLANRYHKIMTKIWNARIVYYKHLQEFSDKVTLPESENAISLEGSLATSERLISESNELLSKAQTRFRFLSNLVNSNHMEQKCCICLCNLQIGILLQCAHFGCNSCLRSYFKINKLCPICRSPVTSQTPIVFEQVPKPTVLTEMKPATSNARNMSRFNEWKYEMIIGDYSTKVKSLVQILSFLRRQNGKTKSIIFSQWRELLKVISFALKENGFKFVSLDSSSSYMKEMAINSFNSDDQITVFLLSSRSEAAGLTLTAASNIFLMEPNLSPAIELQAINRVHRIGQEKETTVYRLITLNSIENDIFNGVDYSSIDNVKSDSENFEILCQSIFNQVNDD